MSVQNTDWSFFITGGTAGDAPFNTGHLVLADHKQRYDAALDEVQQGKVVPLEDLLSEADE
jgi:hypothetical protein